VLFATGSLGCGHQCPAPVNHNKVYLVTVRLTTNLVGVCLQVYSTCTLNPSECEGNVRWVLDRYGQGRGTSAAKFLLQTKKHPPSTLRLIRAAPPHMQLLGGPGLVGADPDTGNRLITMNSMGLVLSSQADMNVVQCCVAHHNAFSFSLNTEPRTIHVVCALSAC
jgi:hypothetical protein